MADIVFVNNASSLLAASINNLDTVIQLSSGDGTLFPVFTAPEFFVATLEDDAGNIEVVQCTARTGDLLTVVRGFDNSVAQSFAMTTTRVELRLTAAVMEEMIQRNGDIMTGDLDMDGNSLTDAVIDGPNTQMINGEIVDVPLRGLAGVSTNEIAVPVDGTSRATAGGANIRVEGDDLTGDVASATETSEGIAEIADQTEMDAGTDDDRFVTPKKFRDTAAAISQRGTLRTAGITQTEAGTSDDRAVTPEAFAGTAAAEGQIGTIAVADQATVDAGLDDTQAVTPAKLSAFPNLAGNRRGALATHTAAFGAPNTGGTNPFPQNPAPHPFNTTVFDSEGVDVIHDDNSNNTRLTVPPGVTAIRLTFGCEWDNDPGGRRHMQIRKNGGTGGVDPGMANFKPFSTFEVAGNGGPKGSQIITPIISVVAGNYFECFLETQAAQTAPTFTIANQSWFEMEVIA